MLLTNTTTLAGGAVYYILTCPEGAMERTVLLEYVPDDDMRSWSSGEAFGDDPHGFPEEARPPEPVRFRVPTGHSGTLKALYEAPAPVMKTELADALRAAGVDNVQWFAAEIEWVGGDRETDYEAFNVVGLIDAADRSRSHHDPDLNWFDTLLLSEHQADWPLMFRLKGAPHHLMVHQQVRAHLEEAGFDMLQFTDPQQPRRGS